MAGTPAKGMTAGHSKMPSAKMIAAYLETFDYATKEKTITVKRHRPLDRITANQLCKQAAWSRNFERGGNQPNSRKPKGPLGGMALARHALARPPLKSGTRSQTNRTPPANRGC
jgi:hypothetical protein